MARRNYPRKTDRLVEGRYEVAFSGRTALVVCIERYGISRPRLASHLLPMTIPVRGRVDWLSVSVGASILLYSVGSSAVTVDPVLTG